MSKYNWGRKRIAMHNGFPRLFLHERSERIVRWLLRTITVVGILVSLLSLPILWSFGVAVLLVAIDTFIERTLFYYTSLYVNEIFEEYDAEEWIATVFSFIGESPEDPSSFKVVGPVFKSKDYAIKFMDMMYKWNGGESDEQKDLRLTFLTDENRYYVFFYSDPDHSRFQEFRDMVESKNQVTKYGKDHFPVQLQMVICKGFDIGNLFALGLFLDNCSPDDKYLLIPHIVVNGRPQPVSDACRIVMQNYKHKIPVELTQDDHEYYHWHKVIKD